jgi:hypothetical protein
LKELLLIRRLDDILIDGLLLESVLYKLYESGELNIKAWIPDISGMVSHQDLDFHRLDKKVVLYPSYFENTPYTSANQSGHNPHNQVDITNPMLPRLIDMLGKPDLLAYVEDFSIDDRLDQLSC